MRFTYVVAAVGIAIAVLFMGPVVLMGASSARADDSGYRRCVEPLRNSHSGNPTHEVCSLLDLLRWISNLVLTLLQKLKK
jgi:hypothetical protein